ncbi:sulfotransferase family 2 domain-containing protein [Priestia megaterium]|uniref:sulfotransferase family 2 domain-containing protein n=1 Tax=Priestia megaterium TaxID=1404 RepID=UPI00273163FB|nr:sulfotransferase family 2 domain-containing protein [Priestia megaterium]MDP1383243.1 sulfotransferase family 2 domain-containing protein [Priestia megaterium]MDP1427389.1 sulfotransferase family 2 domain-containing protein [Priestia megaterium]
MENEGDIKNRTSQRERLKNPNQAQELCRKIQELKIIVEELESIAQELESNSQELESNSQELESNSQELESNSQELESNSQELESNSQELESNSQELESNSQELESNSQELESKIILSLHIPKTAGSTLNNILDNLFTLHEKVNYYGGDYDIFINNLKSLTKDNDTLKCINGHFRFGIHEQIQRPFTYITMLRHPVERVISTYYYIRRVPAHYLYEAIKDITLEEFILSEDESIKYSVCNMQTTFISGEYPPNLNKAKKNLEEFFDFVGITEMFDQSLFLMRKIFGWDISSYESVNVTQNRPPLKTHSEDVITLIRERNQLDLKIYEFGKLLFDKKIESLDKKERVEMENFLDYKARYGETSQNNKENL